MTDDPLTPEPLTLELAELERELIAGRDSLGPWLPARLNARVRRELRRTRRPRHFLLGWTAAAVLLIGLHLSWLNEQRAFVAAPAEALPVAELDHAAREVQSLLPELSEQEARRHVRRLMISGPALPSRRALLSLPFALYSTDPKRG